MFDVSLSQLGYFDWIVNGLVVLAVGCTLAVLVRPAIRRSSVWRATVTPLASIIGSGFLVVAPLLGFTVGRYALVAMVAIVALAYLVGSAVRYNIRHVEELTEAEGRDGRMGRVLEWLGRVAKVVLAAAYVIAVTFYLELLGAFVLRLFGLQGTTHQKWIASALLVFIGGFGLWRGLRLLESLETWAVETKLAIIAGLLVGLVCYNGELLVSGGWALPTLATEIDLRTVRQILGAFLIVQGFETSRYLRGEYPAEHRVRTMRYAQWISAAIYLTFILLATVLLDVADGVSETAIIDLSERVAFVLPFLLVVAAAMSQFSAAIADTIGSGGLVKEASHDKVPHRFTYAAVAGLALVLLWTTDILQVIAFASRAFAAYYALQCTMAAIHALGGEGDDRRAGHGALFIALALLMVITAIFGIPAESAGGG